MQFFESNEIYEDLQIYLETATYLSSNGNLQVSLLIGHIKRLSTDGESVTFKVNAALRCVNALFDQNQT